MEALASEASELDSKIKSVVSLSEVPSQQTDTEIQINNQTDKQNEESLEIETNPQVDGKDFIMAMQSRKRNRVDQKRSNRYTQGPDTMQIEDGPMGIEKAIQITTAVDKEAESHWTTTLSNSRKPNNVKVHQSPSTM